MCAHAREARKRRDARPPASRAHAGSAQETWLRPLDLSALPGLAGAWVLPRTVCDNCGHPVSRRPRSDRWLPLAARCAGVYVRVPGPLPRSDPQLPVPRLGCLRPDRAGEGAAPDGWRRAGRRDSRAVLGPARGCCARSSCCPPRTRAVVVRARIRRRVRAVQRPTWGS